MKHAILLTAYKNVHHITQMADVLDERFSFYVHFDRKSRVSAAELHSLRHHRSVKLIEQKFKVNWAGVNHLLAIISLLKAALRSDAEIFHALSGQDFPIKSAEEIDAFFRNNQNKQFIEHFALPAGHWTDGGMHRIRYRYFYDLFDNKTRYGHFINRVVLKLQKISGVHRIWPNNLPPLYGGGTWWSITRDCAEYVINYAEQHPQLLQRLRYTLCPEEEFFQTIILNSVFAEEAVSNHLRYIDWNSRNGNAPANLDESDFEKLMQSEKLFARKMDYPVSEKLIAQITERIKSA